MYKSLYDNLPFYSTEKKLVKQGGLRTKGYFKASYENKPLISVVTVVLNGEAFLEETIISVINQKYENVEYIIIDGGSSDGTLDIIRKYEDSIDYWVSEKDGGIYYGMNKGIAASTGDTIGLICAGDYYDLDALSDISMYKNLDSIIVTGDMCKVFDRLNTAFVSSKSNEDLKNAYKIMPINHPATFVGSSVYKKIGLFDLRYKICSDSDFVMKALSNNVSIKFHKGILSYMRMGGISDSMKSIPLMTKEHFLIRKIYNISLLENINISVLFFLTKTVRHILIKIIPDLLVKKYYMNKKA